MIRAQNPVTINKGRTSDYLGPLQVKRKKKFLQGGGEAVSRRWSIK